MYNYMRVFFNLMYVPKNFKGRSCLVLPPLTTNILFVLNICFLNTMNF